MNGKASCRPWWKGIRLEDSLLKRGERVCELEQALAGLLEDLKILLAECSHCSKLKDERWSESYQVIQVPTYLT